MRTERILESTKEIDEAERIWWDTNAEIIEKIWAQNLELQKQIRLSYLSRMKKFFLSDSSKRPFKVLEIGCGTGWVGRLVAGPDLHIIGTDFSEGQLTIARQMAKQFGQDKYCVYELADASSFQDDVDGVIIHALLHHLSAKELEIFFGQFAKFKPGTKIFIYEPVFFNKQTGEKSFFDKVTNKLIDVVKTYALNRAKKIGHEDTELVLQMDSIFKAADKNGWYISPKEVPFYENELENFLSPLCDLKRKYIVNKTDLDLSQALTFYGIQKPDFIFSKVLFPVAKVLDKASLKGKFTHYLPPNQHLFVCYEWIRK
jgi:2-polyprenyl-3-methyl-5-hydroxy-6-metoxy-1,4-benzoquinol methylase